MTTALAVVAKASEPTLNDLAETIREEISATQAAVASALEHALAAGDALIVARRKVQHGRWWKWLVEHDINGNTASLYIRLARCRDVLTDSGISTIADARRALREANLQIGLSFDGDLTYEIRKRRAAGRSKREIARDLDIPSHVVSSRIHTGQPQDRRHIPITDEMIEGMATWLVRHRIMPRLDDNARDKATSALRTAFGLE